MLVEHYQGCVVLLLDNRGPGGDEHGFCGRIQQPYPRQSLLSDD